MSKQKIDTIGVINAMLEGQLPGEIAEKFGCERIAISHARRALGLAHLKRGPRGPHGSTRGNCETALKLKAEGKTYQEIGEIMNVTRQRAQQMVMAATNRPDYKPGVPCGECGATDKNLHAHHTDYVGGPLILLCVSCHGKHHGRPKKKV